jgi:hypothetical protein
MAFYCAAIKMMLNAIEYAEIHRDDLIAILRQNVPKYFSGRDIADFRKYLQEKPWDGHDVFVDPNYGIVGCASYYIKSPSVVGLSWMFFSPFRLGYRRILPTLEEFISSICARISTQNRNLTFSLNTTPQVAKVLGRIGFKTIGIVKDGYGPGYDKVNMFIEFPACVESAPRRRPSFPA